MNSHEEQSKLVWILRQLISSETPKRWPLERGLKLSWYPAGENGECELRAGRRDSHPSEQENRIVLGSLAVAAKAEGLIVCDMRMSPALTFRGRHTYYVTSFIFRLASQPPLIEVPK
jgi:hypothetical protein